MQIADTHEAALAAVAEARFAAFDFGSATVSDQSAFSVDRDGDAETFSKSLALVLDDGRCVRANYRLMFEADGLGVQDERALLADSGGEIGFASSEARKVLVDEASRHTFLPSLFAVHYLRGESLLFDLAREFSGGYYKGGYWEFVSIPQLGALYAYPDLGADPVPVTCAGNYYEGRMSADAFGIVLTLYTLNRLMWRAHDQPNQPGLALLIDRYYALLRFVDRHAESSEILSAID